MKIQKAHKSKIKATKLIIVLLCVVILAPAFFTGCARDQVINFRTNYLRRHWNFLDASLGDFEIVRRENMTSTSRVAAIAIGFDALMYRNQIVNWIEWELEYTDVDGETRIFSFSNRNEFSVYVLRHANSSLVRNIRQDVVDEFFGDDSNLTIHIVTPYDRAGTAWNRPPAGYNRRNALTHRRTGLQFSTMRYDLIEDWGWELTFSLTNPDCDCIESCRALREQLESMVREVSRITMQNEVRYHFDCPAHADISFHGTYHSDTSTFSGESERDRFIAENTMDDGRLRHFLWVRYNDTTIHRRGWTRMFYFRDNFRGQAQYVILIGAAANIMSNFVCFDEENLVIMWYVDGNYFELDVGLVNISERTGERVDGNYRGQSRMVTQLRKNGELYRYFSSSGQDRTLTIEEFEDLFGVEVAFEHDTATVIISRNTPQ